MEWLQPATNEFKMDCAMQVLAKPIFLRVINTLRFSGFWRGGTFIAKGFAHLTGAINKRQSPSVAGIACIPAFSFLALSYRVGVQ